MSVWLVMLQKNVYDLYVSSIPRLLVGLGTNNPHALPSVEKVVISMGLGSCLGDRKKIDEAAAQLTQISGQRAVISRAKKSVSGFRLREGVDVGCCVTLRKKRMYSFLTRLLFLVLPRVRDFRGLSPKSFDNNGNYALGIKEQIIFPEINYDKIEKVRGLDVVICTTAKTNKEALSLLKKFNLPILG